MMKKITLALVLFNLGLQAQTFPDPYCDIDDSGTTVEEITLVNFGQTSIANTDASSILIDETATITNVNHTETISVAVEGNTYGDFGNEIVLFIDWNQNEILDDIDEVYELGTLTNSTGSDGISVNMNITVPPNALTGETRARLTKTYADEDSPAIVNPCAIEMDAFGQGAFPGYGQALDFTIDVGALQTSTFDKNALSVYPIPAKEVLNIEYKTALNSVKVFNILGQEVLSQKVDVNELQVNISSLNKGVYMVKLFTEETQHSFKIVKE